MPILLKLLVPLLIPAGLFLFSIPLPPVVALAAETPGGQSENLRLLEEAAWGDTGAARRLIDSGMDLSTRNRDGETLLYLAATFGWSDLVKELLEKGADVNVRIDRYPNRGWTPLHAAADRGKLDAARALIAGGADVNAATESGSTALIFASFRGNDELARVLIKAGADVNTIDTGGTTALSWAAGDGREELTAELLAAGARLTGLPCSGRPWPDTPAWSAG